MSVSHGLAAHWTMSSHDIEGDVIRDRTGNNNHLTMSGGVTTGADSIMGDAVELDGVDGELRFNQEITMDRNAATLSFWVKPNAITGYTLFRDTSTTYKLIELRSGRINCEPNRNCNAFNNGAYSMTTDWHHIAVAFDGTHAFWYLNGEFQTEATAYGATACGDEGVDVDYMVEDTTLSRIGSPAYDAYYDGKISDVRFYDRTLSDVEIRVLGNMRSPKQLHV